LGFWRREDAYNYVSHFVAPVSRLQKESSDSSRREHCWYIDESGVEFSFHEPVWQFGSTNFQVGVLPKTQAELVVSSLLGFRWAHLKVSRGSLGAHETFLDVLQSKLPVASEKTLPLISFTGA
jgi:hypothetical protein